MDEFYSNLYETLGLLALNLVAVFGAWEGITRLAGWVHKRRTHS